MSTVKFLADMVSQRPFPKLWWKANITYFPNWASNCHGFTRYTSKHMFLEWWILIKHFGNSLLFNKSVKIQDGCQSTQLFLLQNFFQCCIMNYLTILCGYSQQIMMLIVKLRVTWPCQYHFLSINHYIMVSQTRNFYSSNSNYHTCMVFTSRYFFLSKQRQ